MPKEATRACRIELQKRERACYSCSARSLAVALGQDSVLTIPNPEICKNLSLSCNLTRQARWW